MPSIEGGCWEVLCEDYGIQNLYDVFYVGIQALE
jgi:hypothetical protein